MVTNVGKLGKRKQLLVKAPWFLGETPTKPKMLSNCHFNLCLLLIFDICAHAAAGRILEGFHLNYGEDLCEVSFSEVVEEHHRRLEEWKTWFIFPESVNKPVFTSVCARAHTHTPPLCWVLVYLSYTTLFSRKQQVINLSSHILWSSTLKDSSELRSADLSAWYLQRSPITQLHTVVLGKFWVLIILLLY